MAVSNRCEHPDIAVDYAAYTASPECQRNLFFENGGQPGHRGRGWMRKRIAGEFGSNYCCETLVSVCDNKRNFRTDDEIRILLVEHLKSKSTGHWLELLEQFDYWCAEVMDWGQLLKNEGFQVLQMIQSVYLSEGTAMLTTRYPIRIDGMRLFSDKGSPQIGTDNFRIKKELVEA